MPELKQSLSWSVTPMDADKAEQLTKAHKRAMIARGIHSDGPPELDFNKITSPMSGGFRFTTTMNPDGMIDHETLEPTLSWHTHNVDYDKELVEKIFEDNVTLFNPVGVDDKRRITLKREDGTYYWTRFLGDTDAHLIWVNTVGKEAIIEASGIDMTDLFQVLLTGQGAVD